MARKVVLDTNVWVSYAINRKANALLDLILNHSIAVFSDRFLRQELLEVLSRDKFKTYLSELDIAVFLQFFDSLVETVNTTSKFTGSPDPNDDFLFDLAFQSGATHIVTGDKKLLNFNVPKVKIISLSTFKNSLKK